MPVPSATPPVERRSLREVAVERIRTAIFDGTLDPGEHLNDGELQLWLGISRTPIREALNDLARVGLVEMAAQRYTRVALPDPAQRTELMQTLGAMLGGVVRVTVPGLGATQKKAIGRSIDQLRVVIDERDAAEYDRLSRSLFDAFIDACPNPTLVDATKDIINGLSYRVSVMTTPEAIDWDTKLVAFPALSDALQADDAVAAELAVEDVFRLSKSLSPRR